MKVVQQKDMYGLEVIETLSNQLDVNENTVYPILRRLTKQGFFETYQKKSTVGPPRKYYRLTDDGQKQLKQFEQEWMSFLSSVMNVLKGENYERDLSQKIK
jgi:PadR family transcriptional regulator PadR